MATVDQRMAVRRSVDLLIELHLLMRDGGGETDRADELREASEELWWNLTAHEKERFPGLSADLMVLEPESPVQHPQTGGVLSEHSRRTLEDLLLVKDWEGILEFLRVRPGEVSEDLAAYYRGRCWSELGEHRAAVEFLQYAAQRNSAFAPALILPLIFTDRVEEAASLCRSLLPVAETMVPYNTLLVANGCCLLAARLALAERRWWFEQAITVFDKVLSKMREFGDGGLSPQVLAGNYVALALCHQILGHHEESREACEAALALDPENPQALILHGLILQGWPGAGESAAASREIERGFWNALVRQAASPPLTPSLLAA